MLQLIHVTTYPCYNLPMLQLIHVTTYPCYNLPMLQLTHVTTYPCYNLSMLQLTHVTTYPCYNLSMLQLTHVTTYPCYNLPMLQLIHVTTSRSLPYFPPPQSMAYNTGPTDNTESPETTQLLRQLQGKVKILQMENANLKKAGRLSISVPDLSANCQNMVSLHYPCPTLCR